MLGQWLHLEIFDHHVVNEHLINSVSTTGSSNLFLVDEKTT